MNYSRTIPVVNIAGPGSQPEEEDFNFLPIPAGINLPLTPVLPEQALPAELRVARHILTTLIRDMDNPVATLPFPLSYKLNATEQQIALSMAQATTCSLLAGLKRPASIAEGATRRQGN